MKSCCQYVAERIERYHDGALPADEAREVERCLEACADCSAQYERLRRIDAVGVAAFYREPDAAYWADLSARIAARTTRVPQPAVSLWDRLRAAATAILDGLPVPRAAVGFAAAAVVLLVTIQVAFHPFTNPLIPNPGGYATLPAVTPDQPATPEPAAPPNTAVPRAPAAPSSVPAAESTAQPAAPNAPAAASHPDVPADAPMSTLERINPLRDQSRLAPLVTNDKSAAPRSNVADLIEEPDPDNARLSKEGSLLDEGGIERPGENSGTLTMKSPLKARQAYATDQNPEHSNQRTDANAALQQLSTEQLSARKDRLLAGLKTEEDPLIRNAAIEELDDLYVVLLDRDAGGRYINEARNFYTTYKEPLTALLGSQQYLSRLSLLER